MRNHKRIFIIGHSGAGKGVLAEAVAKKLNWKYVNTDFSLAPSIGKTSHDILGEQGDLAFSHCLSQILEHQTHQENIVVTTDDSIVCSAQNRKLLSKEFTVYLKVSIDVQLDRIGHNRPLLPCKDFKAFIQQLHDERDALYEQSACFSLSSDNGDIDRDAQQIVDALKK
ncbi:MAG: shikimate kinase [Coxiellaceae bacterium]|nr:shikimate kinase [Coxiellaceae bacterium]